VYALFEIVARALGSDRGQAGVAVAVAVIGATAAVDRWIGGPREEPWTRRLGLGAPASAGVVLGGVACALLILVVPAYFALTRETPATHAGWGWLLPGLVAQAGVAEEVLFRAFLFGNLRRGRSFWKAAIVATGPFALVHLWLFVGQPWPVASAAVLLSVAISFPLARLFDAGGGTIWGPALLHAVVQGVPKIVSADSGDATFGLTWIACSAVLPYVVFLAPRSARA
jgi:membrane protease YdiL (CAAX protease family)